MKIRNYKIEHENNEEVLILYVDPSYYEEFALDDHKLIDQSKQSLEQSFRGFIKRHLPNKRIKKVKLMVGTLLLATITLSQTAYATDFTMSYLYFGGTSSYIEFVDRTEGILNVVSPSYFDLNPDGSLRLTHQFDERFIEEMHARHIKVVPFLSNHWNRELGRTALANRELLSTQIAEAIEKYNLDGVNVDIENVTHVDKEAFTDLVRLLREKIPVEKEVSVAVAANPNGWTQGWHGSYDYKALGELADYLMIMAYDESYEGSAPGPVASLSFVERSIQYALNQGVPKEKIVLGLPFYGRYWVEGESVGGFGIPKNRVEEAVVLYNGTIHFDERSQSPYATFTIRQGDPTMVIGGRTLQPGNYTIWFEDERSIQAKVEMAINYGIKGTGSWALGQENPDLWASYASWIKPNQEPAEVEIPYEPDPIDVVEQDPTEEEQNTNTGPQGVARGHQRNEETDPVETTRPGNRRGQNR